MAAAGNGDDLATVDFWPAFRQARVAARALRASYAVVFDVAMTLVTMLQTCAALWCMRDWFVEERTAFAWILVTALGLCNLVFAHLASFGNVRLPRCCHHNPIAQMTKLIGFVITAPLVPIVHVAGMLALETRDEQLDALSLRTRFGPSEKRSRSRSSSVAVSSRDSAVIEEAAADELQWASSDADSTGHGGGSGAPVPHSQQTPPSPQPAEALAAEEARVQLEFDVIWSATSCDPHFCWRGDHRRHHEEARSTSASTNPLQSPSDEEDRDAPLRDSRAAATAISDDDGEAMEVREQPASSVVEMPHASNAAQRHGAGSGAPFGSGSTGTDVSDDRDQQHRDNDENTHHNIQTVQTVSAPASPATIGDEPFPLVAHNPLVLRTAKPSHVGSAVRPELAAIDRWLPPWATRRDPLSAAFERYGPFCGHATLLSLPAAVLIAVYFLLGNAASLSVQLCLGLSLLAFSMFMAAVLIAFDAKAQLFCALLVLHDAASFGYLVTTVLLRNEEALPRSATLFGESVSWLAWLWVGRLLVVGSAAVLAGIATAFVLCFRDSYNSRSVLGGVFIGGVFTIVPAALFGEVMKLSWAAVWIRTQSPRGGWVQHALVHGFLTGGGHDHGADEYQSGPRAFFSGGKSRSFCGERLRFLAAFLSLPRHRGTHVPLADAAYRAAQLRLFAAAPDEEVDAVNLHYAYFAPRLRARAESKAQRDHTAETLVAMWTVVAALYAVAQLMVLVYPFVHVAMRGGFDGLPAISIICFAVLCGTLVVALPLVPAATRYVAYCMFIRDVVSQSGIERSRRRALALVAAFFAPPHANALQAVIPRAVLPAEVAAVAAVFLRPDDIAVAHVAAPELHALQRQITSSDGFLIFDVAV